MSRVETHAQALRLLNAVEDCGEVSDFVPETTPLSGGVLKRYSHLGRLGRGKYLVQSGNGLVNPHRFTRAEMRAWMQDNKRQLEQSGELDFLDKGTDGN